MSRPLETAPQTSTAINAAPAPDLLIMSKMSQLFRVANGTVRHKVARFPAGIHEAEARNAAGAILVLLDGDGQPDPAEIPRPLEKLDASFDMAIGARATTKYHANSARLLASSHRHSHCPDFQANHVARRQISRLSGLNTFTQSSMRAHMPLFIIIFIFML